MKASLKNHLIKELMVLFGVLLSLAAGVANGQAAGAGIAGTAHDPRSWNFGYPDGQICVMCHAPHNTTTDGPLWNHQMSTAAYTLYASSTMNAIVGQPGQVSKLCMSCHDGTVGILNYGGATGGMTLFDAYGQLGRSVLGSNMADDHPIGITYNAALATSDGSLADPATKTVTIGASTSKSGTIAALMLVGGKIECTSCHDVHNKFTVGSTTKNLLKVSVAGSVLCLQCHTK
jgi:predicted CXXCH cytochrome family protein